MVDSFTATPHPGGTTPDAAHKYYNYLSSCFSAFLCIYIRSLRITNYYFFILTTTYFIQCDANWLLARSTSEGRITSTDEQMAYSNPDANWDVFRLVYSSLSQIDSLAAGIGCHDLGVLDKVVLPLISNSLLLQADADPLRKA